MRILALLALLCFVAPALAQKPPAKFLSVKILRVAKEAEELVGVTVDLTGTELPDTYEVPGQFVQLKVDDADKPGFFALANGPDGSARWDLLLKTGSPLADKVAALKAGDSLQITPAQGTGFPIAEHKGQDMIVLAMGSGISAGRALIENALAHRSDEGAITLIVGGKTPAHLAYGALMDGWSRKGVRVIQCITTTDVQPPWTGATGFVQNQLTRDMLNTHATAVYVVGSPEMVQGTTQKLVELGPAGMKPLTNF